MAPTPWHHCTRRKWEGNVQRLKGYLDPHWPWAFLWLLVIPIITVPLTLVSMSSLSTSGVCERVFVPREGYSGLFASDYSCPRVQSLLTHAPGLLNLVPAIWLTASTSRVRLIAALATGIGATRLAAPAVSIQEGAHLSCSIICSFVSEHPSWLGFLGWVGLVGWLLTAVVLVALLWRFPDEGGAPTSR